MVSLLLRSGASPDARTPGGGVTPLHRAAYKGRARCVELLMGKGKKHVEKVASELEKKKILCFPAFGADPFLLDEDGLSALHKAAAEGQGETYGAILAAVSDTQKRWANICWKSGEGEE